MARLKISAAVILTEAKDALARGRRYATDIARLAITGEWLDQFEQEIAETEALPAHLFNQMDLKGLTQDKDEFLSECYDWARMLETRIEFRYGVDSKLYRRFPNTALTDARNSEQKMLPIMEGLVKLATKHAKDLAEAGQTPEELQVGVDLLEELRAADARQEEKKDLNLEATQERVEAHQNLYDKVNQINKAGRRLFRNDPISLASFRSPWPKYRTSGPESDTEGESAGDSLS